MNLTLWKPEAQRAERRMGTMRKYPGCSPIARPSRSNVFFSQSSMKVARHRLILLNQRRIPAKHPRQGHPPHPKPLTVENPKNHTTCLSHGIIVPHTDPHCGRLARGDWRRAPLPAAGPALSLSGGEPHWHHWPHSRQARYAHAQVCVCPAPLT